MPLEPQPLGLRTHRKSSATPKRDGSTVERESTPQPRQPSSLTGQACVTALLDSTNEAEDASDCLGLLAPVRGHRDVAPALNRMIG